jgi:hypothetical protein
MDGQTKCTVFTPWARKAVSRAKLKSGASTPTNNSGRSLNNRWRKALRMANSSRRWRNAST